MSRSLRIALIEDDRSVLESTKLVFEACGLRVKCFEAASAFIAQYKTSRTWDCIVCDVLMPGMTGLMLQEWLQARSDHTPFVFITGHGQVDMAVRAMKTGAADFVEKPFDAQQLAVVITKLAKRAHRAREERAAANLTRERILQLTRRERQVLELMLEGLSSRDIAGHLSIGIRTLESHRAAIMAKLGARGLVDLVKMVIQSGGLAATAESEDAVNALPQ